MHAPATPPLRHWTTDAAPPLARLDYWIGAVCEGFLDMEVASTRADFSAELVSAPFGALTFNRVQGSAQDVYRTRRGIARSRQDCHYLLCKTDGAWSGAQGAASARLQPGDLLLVDAGRCYEFHFTSSCSTVSLELPTPWLRRWLPEPAAVTGRRIDGGNGFGSALSAFVQQLRPELALAPPAPAALVTDQLGALLALACAAAPSGPTDPALQERVRQALHDRHAEPGLTAAAVAQGLGVGERSLHRALAAGGALPTTTFATLLAQVRCQAACRLLQDSRFDRLTVSELGRRVGLPDASHFVRVFRRVVGCTPGVFRQRR